MNNEISNKMSDAMDKYNHNTSAIYEMQKENRSIKQFLIGEVLKNQPLAEKVLTLNIRLLYNLIHRM